MASNVMRFENTCEKADHTRTVTAAYFLHTDLPHNALLYRYLGARRYFSLLRIKMSTASCTMKGALERIASRHSLCICRRDRSLHVSARCFSYNFRRFENSKSYSKMHASCSLVCDAVRRRRPRRFVVGAWLTAKGVSWTMTGLPDIVQTPFCITQLPASHSCMQPVFLHPYNVSTQTRSSGEWPWHVSGQYGCAVPPAMHIVALMC